MPHRLSVRVRRKQGLPRVAHSEVLGINGLYFLEKAYESALEASERNALTREEGGRWSCAQVLGTRLLRERLTGVSVRPNQL